MKKHKKIVIPLLVLLIALAAYLWQHRVFALRAAANIVYVDRKTVPMLIWTGSDDNINALSFIDRAYRVEVYAANGKIARRDKVRAASSDTGILVSTSGRASRYIDINHEVTQQPNLVWLSVNRQRVVSRRLSIRPAFPIWVANALAQGGDMYVVGEANIFETASYPTIVRVGRYGKLVWAKTERVNSGVYDKVVMDREGNLIAAGTVGSAMGTFVAKYSSGGQRLWLKNSIVNDSEYTVWIGIRQAGNIAAIVRLHSKNYVLVTCDGNGKCISQQQLTCGPDIDIADAALNNRDELYVLCNRKSYGNALLTKYDARGKTAWSGIVNLPEECKACQILLGHTSAYIYGYWPPYASTVPDGPYVKAFIYKIPN